MIYLTGVLRRDQMARLESIGLGAMLTPASGYRMVVTHSERMPFACDTGLYSVNGQREFDLAAYLRWLDGLPRDRCLFATAPDTPGEWEETLARSLPVLPQLRALGFPAAICAQNGADESSVPWSEIDVLFVGGRIDDAGREWKTSAAAWSLISAALRRGIPVHQGRVNSGRRLRTAQLQGCRSADGTFLARAPLHNIARIERWLADIGRQPPLFVADACPELAG